MITLAEDYIISNLDCAVVKLLDLSNGESIINNSEIRVVVISQQCKKKKQHPKFLTPCPCHQSN